MFSRTTVRAGKSTPAATVAVAKIESRSPALISRSIASFHAGRCPAWCEATPPRKTMSQWRCFRTSGYCSAIS
jgi:hypothetical protein